MNIHKITLNLVFANAKVTMGWRKPFPAAGFAARRCRSSAVNPDTRRAAVARLARLSLERHDSLAFHSMSSVIRAFPIVYY